MAQFEAAIGTVLKHEGGFVNNPRDPGGATNYGISLKFLRSQNIIDGDFDHSGSVDVNDIKSMKVHDAVDIYQQLWQRYGYDRITDNTIATKIFDMSINMGQKQAIKLVQQVCIGYNLTASSISNFVDGIMGVYTVEAINLAALMSDLLGRLRKACEDFYLQLIEKNPSLAEFKEGWMRRAQS